MGAQSNPLFVYGALLDDELRTIVIGRRRPLMMASGQNVRSRTIAKTGLAGLVDAPGTEFSGALVWGLSEEEWLRVARFEGEGYELRKIDVAPTDGGPLIDAYAFFARASNELLPNPWHIASWAPESRYAMLREAMLRFGAPQPVKMAGAR